MVETETAQDDSAATVVEIPSSPQVTTSNEKYVEDVEPEIKEEMEEPPADTASRDGDGDDDHDNHEEQPHTSSAEANIPMEDFAIPTDDYDVPTTVSEERKNKLLQEARANRVAWIEKVPLPYQKDPASLLDTTHIAKELPSATKILAHLYGDTETMVSQIKELIPSAVANSPAMRTTEELLEDELLEADDHVQTILKDYQTFLQKLERPESAIAVNSMRASLTRLGHDPATSLRSFVSSTLEQLKRHHQLQNEEWNKRSLESFLYGQTQEAIWSTIQQEQEEDSDLTKKLQNLDFINPKHLDLTCLANDQDHLGIAVSNLLSMQRFYSPYEKLQQILKTYHAINEALTKAQGGKLPSADDVLPALILTVVKAKPTKLVSNLRMLEVFSPPEYLRGEAGYAYTNLYGAVQFLRDLKLDEEGPITSLTISPEEFKEGLVASRLAMETQIEKHSTAKEIMPEEVPPFKSIEIPVAEVRAARLRGETVDVSWARQRFTPTSVHEGGTASGEATAEVEDILPTGFSRNYSFVATRPEEIRMSDLPQLLREYRMLVRATETLISERAQRASMERKERLLKAAREIQKNAIEADLGLVGRPLRKKPL